MGCVLTKSDSDCAGRLAGWGHSEGPGPPLAPLTTRDGMVLAQSPREAEAPALPGLALAWTWGSKPPWAVRPAGLGDPASPRREDVSGSSQVHPQLAYPSENGPDSAGPTYMSLLGATC